MKRHCVVITAYRNPKMLENLLKVLTGYMRCFVYVDKRTWSLFESLQDKFPNVVFHAPFKVMWGGIEHLEEILMGFNECIESRCDYIHILSGEDYPTVPMTEIIDFFEYTDGVYSDCHLPSQKEWSIRYQCRWPYVKFHMDYKYNAITRLFNRTVVGIQEIFPFLQRNEIGELKEVYMGLIWASYPSDAAEYIVEYLGKHHEFWDDLKTCKIPEEFCFPTIMMNSPFRERMMFNNLRFGRFASNNSWGPAYAELNDLATIEATGKMFARKIDNHSELYRFLERRQH